MSNVIVQATVSYGRIAKVLDAPDSLDLGTVDVTLSGKITVSEVSLSYGGKNVLKNISFEVKPGSKVAIVGPTVAGKTTLLSSLAGMAIADSGENQV